MRLDAAQLNELADVAVDAAIEAGEMIGRSRPRAVEHKDGDKTAVGVSLAAQVVTEVDRRSEAMILGRLAPTLERFDLGLLTEERDDDASRLTKDYFWCVDPLDGTLPFIEGRAGYAVSIALVDRSGCSWIGVVYDPVGAVAMHAVRGEGICRHGEPWSVPTDRRPDVLSVFADRSLLAGDDAAEVERSLDGLAAKLGLTGARTHVGAGAVMNACGALVNPPGCYMKFPAPSGGGCLWDFAATACLFAEAGAVVGDIHGERLDLNRPDGVAMNHRGVVFATDESIAEGVRQLHREPGRSR